MHRKTIFTIGAIALLGLAWQAPARADGLYIGGAAHAATGSYQNSEDTDTTTSLTVGYTFFDSSFLMLSAEVSRYDLGSFSDGGNNFEADATALGAVATLPLGPAIELYGKLGVASVDGSINGTGFDGDENYSGVGLGLDFFDTVDLFVEYTKFDNDIDSELLGVGLRLDF